MTAPVEAALVARLAPPDPAEDANNKRGVIIKPLDCNAHGVGQTGTPKPNNSYNNGGDDKIL